MTNLPWYEQTYPDIIKAYPSLTDYSKWVDFEVSMYPHTKVVGDCVNANYPTGIHYVKAAPGNATEYRFFLIDLPEVPERAGLPKGRLLVMDPNPWKCGAMYVNHTPVPSYIMEKLDMGVADAVALSIIVGRLLD